MILSASCTLISEIIANLRSVFAVKDLGPVSYFLGIDVKCTKNGFTLSQASYANNVLERAGMLNCKPAPTPADTKPKASGGDGELVSDPSWYRSMADAP